MKLYSNGACAMSRKREERRCMLASHRLLMMEKIRTTGRWECMLAHTTCTSSIPHGHGERSDDVYIYIHARSQVSSVGVHSPLLPPSSYFFLNRRDARPQCQGLPARLPQELDLEPPSLQKGFRLILWEERHGESPGAEARHQVVGRHRHGHRPRRRSAVAAGHLGLLLLVVVVVYAVQVVAGEGPQVQEDREAVSPREEIERWQCFSCENGGGGGDQQRRDCEAAGEEEDQGAEEDDTRRRVARRHLVAPRGHGLRRASARASRRAPAHLECSSAMRSGGVDRPRGFLFARSAWLEELEGRFNFQVKWRGWSHGFKRAFRREGKDHVERIMAMLEDVDVRKMMQCRSNFVVVSAQRRQIEKMFGSSCNF